ncbi:hypothetical protein Tsubulata_034068 [Turnera subulata]|uniref:Protein kinase domain-containing protein n=1 Tax=Turnera subulata TaxID=218843 RepID=A0A9Q0G127_9ROSI|nr:hypothetical protein Tsubulata_034068 [Turnera subulata]
MADIIKNSHLKVFVFLICSLVPAFGQNLLSCETASPDASGYRCNISESQDQCRTFVILRTNSYFSSLSNFSFHLGINRDVISQANGFSPLCLKEALFLGPQNGLFFSDKVRLQVPLRCACPSSAKVNPATATGLLLSYPVSEGDSISKLSIKFNITPEAIISANNRFISTFKAETLVPFTSLLIPLNGKPTIGPLVLNQPDLHFPASRIPVINPHKKKPKMWQIGVYVAVAAVVIGATVAIAAAFLVIQLKKKKKHQNSNKEQDLELQQLSLSVRTTSDKKVSFEGSQHTVDGSVIDTTTPRKVLVETYTEEELRKATEDFNSSNEVEGSVYHGRLKGKDLAIKRMQRETASKIEFVLLQDPTNHHPNIIRLLGTCLSEDSDSFLVFEYAKNGSLKDWLHGGLAIKSQFIASCYCFLTWDQRVKICLDVAVALQFMHHIMTPGYVHRNIKSRNIFLDEDFTAKVGNFGMARCVEDHTKDSESDPPNDPPASWNLVYLAPEYIREGVVSPGIDIFAYGVILLEILSGQTPRKSLDEKEEEEFSVSLPKKIKSILKSENADGLREWMDSALGDNYSFDAAVSLANLARACIEDDPTLRPNAGEIVDRLLRLVEESPEGEHMLINESSCKPLVSAD